MNWKFLRINNNIQLESKLYYNKDHKLHRLDGPAAHYHHKPNDSIIFKEIYFEEYRFDGLKHRDNGPACITYNKEGEILGEEYWINGKIHREDGPAIILKYDSGVIEVEIYVINMLRHCENGPAKIKYFENGNIKSKEYFINNKRHRIDGPADIKYYENGKICSFDWINNNTNYTDEVGKWMKENSLYLAEMSQSDFDRMWMEIL